MALGSISLVYSTKKRESRTCCSFTHSEAFALPTTEERATQKPHAEYDIRRYTTHQVPYSDTIHIHKASTVATFLTVVLKVAKFHVVKKER